MGEESSAEYNKKRKRKHKSNHSRDHGKHSKKSKKRKKKKRKKSSSDKDRKDTVNNNKDDDQPVFGQYGLIKLSDLPQKQRSFEIWMENVKGLGGFNGPKWEMHNYFKEYAEDYNTATLPHIKYYDYDKWEMEEYQKRKRRPQLPRKTNTRRREQNGRRNCTCVSGRKRRGIKKRTSSVWCEA